MVAGHVVQDALMFTNPIDTDPHTADKDTATYNENMESGIKVVARIHAGNQNDPSERNKGTSLDLQTGIKESQNNQFQIIFLCHYPRSSDFFIFLYFSLCKE